MNAENLTEQNAYGAVIRPDENGIPTEKLVPLGLVIPRAGKFIVSSGANKNGKPSPSKTGKPSALEAARSAWPKTSYSTGGGRVRHFG